MEAHEGEDEDDAARRRRADELRAEIERARRPASPREFTEKAARDAAEEQRRAERRSEKP